MRNIFYGAAIAVCALLVVILVGRLPRSATATQLKTNAILDVRALGSAMDMNTLPRQEVPPEVNGEIVGVALLTATVIDIVAAKTAAESHSYYAAPALGIHVAVPSGMKSFPTDLLPQ
jgi:hypothetical protein